jgi:hypothetical protein
MDLIDIRQHFDWVITVFLQVLALGCRGSSTLAIALYQVTTGVLLFSTCGSLYEF